MVHTMTTNRIETIKQELAPAELQAQNLQFKDKVQFLALTLEMQT